MKTQKKVLSRADAERRLIAQEARLKESERQIKARLDRDGPFRSVMFGSVEVSTLRGHQTWQIENGPLK